MRFPWSKAKALTNDAPSDIPTTEEKPAVAQETPASSQTEPLEKEIEQLGRKEGPIDETPAAGSDKATDGAPPKGTQSKESLQPVPTANAIEHYQPGREEETVDGDKADGLARTTTATTIESDQDGPEDESKYPGGLPLALLTFGLCVGTFVVALDNTIIATAIPRITTVFHSLDDVGWYGSAYLLTTAALQPSLGKVYTYFNVKITYMTAVAVFELGSILCGAAVNSQMLIVGRAVAGCGASGIFSGAMTIIAYSVPLRKRSIYIASVSSMFGIASVVGPILGGAFTDDVSWRWCFYINLPVGAICIALVFFFFTNPERKESKLTIKQKILELDLGGAFFLMGAIICLLLGLQWGGSAYPWSDSKVWGCFIGFGLIISIFIFIQFRRGDRATLPPRILLHQRTVLACAIFSFFLAMGLYACIYYLPIYFQSVKGVSAQNSGIRIVPFLLSNILAAIPVGALVMKVGYYTPFIWVGGALFPVGCGLLKLLKVNSNAGQWIGYQIMAGAGSGICVQLPFIAVQAVLNKKDMPTGNAIAVFFNTMGGAIGVSIAENIFENGLVKQIPKHSSGISAHTIIAAGATQVRAVTPPAQLHGVLVAYNIAVTNVFIIAIAAGCIGFVSSFLFEFRSVKGKNLAAGGAA